MYHIPKVYQIRNCPNISFCANPFTHIKKNNMYEKKVKTTHYIVIFQKLYHIIKNETLNQQVSCSSTTKSSFN